MGSKSYNSIYELRVISYELTDYNRDGIIEPGDEVLLTIVLTNCGGMPSPIHQKMRVYLKSNQWVGFNREDDFIYIPKSLVPGETYRMENLRFTVTEVHQPTVGKRLREVGGLDYRALVERVNKDLPGLRAQVDPFVVQYPVFISAGMLKMPSLSLAFPQSCI